MRLFWGILGLLLLALPARADAIYNISGTATLTGDNSCNGLCVETINFSFQLDEHPIDPVYDALFANNLTITASGPLGPPSPEGSSGFVDDKYMAVNFGASTEFDLMMNPFPPPSLPFAPTGIGGAFYSCAIVGCYGFCAQVVPAPANTACTAPTVQVSITPAGDSSGGPVGTPEPSSLLLLAAGLLSLLLIGKLGIRKPALLLGLVVATSPLVRAQNSKMPFPDFATIKTISVHSDATEIGYRDSVLIPSRLSVSCRDSECDGNISPGVDTDTANATFNGADFNAQGWSFQIMCAGQIYFGHSTCSQLTSGGTYSIQFKGAAMYDASYLDGKSEFKSTGRAPAEIILTEIGPKKPHKFKYQLLGFDSRAADDSMTFYHRWPN